MKVIDLYDRIASELCELEDYPQKIMIEKQIFTLRQDCGGCYWYGREYDHKSIEESFSKNLQDILTLPVEIIEEDKKINKIRIDYNSVNIDKAFEKGTTTFFREKDIEIFQCLSAKINEIIDEINRMEI